jgi:hypothetical protein
VCFFSMERIGDVDELRFGSPNLEWGHLTPNWAYGVSNSSLGFLDECRGFGPSFGAIGHMSTSPDALQCPFPARPVCKCIKSYFVGFGVR